MQVINLVEALEDVIESVQQRDPVVEITTGQRPSRYGEGVEALW